MTTGGQSGWLSASGRDIAARVLAASPDGMVVIDDRGLVVACNQAAADLLERPAAQLIGAQLIGPQQIGPQQIGPQQIGAQLRIPEPGERPADLELPLPDGSVRVIETRSAGAAMGGNRLTVLTLRDGTAGRRAADELASALDHQQMVAAVAAHELHGPLAALSVLAHVLRDRQAAIGPAERARLMARMLDLTDRMQLLVRKLLTAGDGPAARFGSAPEPVRIREVISEQAARAARPDLPVAVTCPSALRAVTDRAGLSIMLGNYLANALAYAGPPVKITAGATGGWAVIRVTDGGPGVPEPFVSHLFERFARGQESAAASPGMGLGLWIVRTLARENDGDAWYEPAPGGGSCFCLRLPLPPPDVRTGRTGHRTGHRTARLATNASSGSARTGRVPQAGGTARVRRRRSSGDAT
ncbi:MAG: sensor histidine kinase [Streptosporangiaceae bacterium]